MYGKKLSFSYRKHFHQLYSIHGWNVVFKLCDDQNLKFEPKTINVDFELGMVNLLREEFREVEIKGCRFHLGQEGYRKIQSLGLAQR